MRFGQNFFEGVVRCPVFTLVVPSLTPQSRTGTIPVPLSDSYIDQIAAFGRILFCGGLIAFGLQNFIFGDFIPGRAPSWPEGWAGQTTFAWLTGVAFLVGGAALLAGRQARAAAVVLGFLVFVWAAVRLIPAVTGDVFIGGNWTRMGKALVIVGGLCAVVAHTVPGHRGKLIFTGRLALGGFMILCGFQHFRWDEFVITLVPQWMPGGGPFWTYVTGVLLILGGAGILIRATARLAAGLSGLMIFLWVPMLHLPRAFAAGEPWGRANEWIAVVEATAFSGLAFYLMGAIGAAQMSKSRI